MLGARYMLIAFVLVACANTESQSAPANSGGQTGDDFHSLVADPTTAGRLYVGGHTSASVSDDDGRTWVVVPALDHADAMGWSIGPGAIWVSGHPGLRVSIDGGATFADRNAGLADTDVHAVGAGGQALYAAGPGLGVALSTDEGLTWTTVSSTSGQSFFGRILIDPANPDHLVAADVRQGASESRDGGRTWTPLGTDPAAWVSSADGLLTIYASGGPVPQRSRDGGATWESVTVPIGASLVEAGPANSLYAGVHSGKTVIVWISTDDGATWNKP